MLIVFMVIAFVVGYIIPACIEFYERMRSAEDEGEGMVSPFSVRSGWFTAFNALTVGMASFLIYRWSDGKIQMLDREAATAVVLAASVSAFASFALLKWLEGVVTVLGYMWDNTVGARRRRLAAQEKAEVEAILEQKRGDSTIEKSLSESIEKGIARGIEKGIARGIEKGIAQGRAEGRAEREAEVEMLKARIAELERDRNGG